MLILDKPLYELCDSGEYWNATMEFYLINYPEMEKAVSHSSLCFKFHGSNLIGVIGNYVDDNINADGKSFESEYELALKNFEFKPQIYGNFTLFGT